MRHRVYGKKLGLNKDERETLFKSLAYSLFSYGTIETSQTKAKAIKGLVDKIINLAKDKTSRHLLQSYMSSKLLQDRLIKEISPKMQNRVSGYTSLTRMGKRSGDNTMMVKMSLIGMEELKPVEKKVTAGPRRGGVQGTVKKTESKKETSEKKVTTKKAVKPAKLTVKKRVSK